MKRLLLLLLLGACTKGAALLPPPVMVSEKPAAYKQDMSQPIHTVNYCDADPSMTVRRRIGLTGTEPGAGRTALLVTVTRTAGAPRWNTSDGTRPTQAQVNRGLVPRIYRPVGLHVERTYKGERVPETLTGFAEGGAIGNDVMNSCAFGSPYRLTLGETRQTVTVGASYVIVLGDEIDGRITGPVVQPVISAIFYVPPGGGLVVGISGRLEVLPS